MTESTATTGRQYTGDELRALLVAGGKYTGRLNIRAAVHLLTFTDLPDWRGFPALVDIERGVHDRARGKTYDVALVRDWAALAEAKAAQSSGSGRRLLALAVSMATGAPVDLRDSLSGFGHAGMRRVIEAAAIATGATEFYTLTLAPTPALDRVLDFHAEMQGTAPAQSSPAPGVKVWLFAPHQETPAELRDALVGWARDNELDPGRVIGSDGVEVDLVDQVIRYVETAAPGDPGAYGGGGNSVWKRRAVAPLLVEPPAALRRPPIGHATLAAALAPYVERKRDALAGRDWSAYERTCAPDRQLDGLGDLALFLGGSEDSFTGRLLALIAKAQATPDRMAALELAFPAEVFAWRTWMGTSPTPTAAELCAELTAEEAPAR